MLLSDVFTQSILEERDSTFCLLRMNKGTITMYPYFAANALSHFDQIFSLFCKIFFTYQCFLRYNLMPYYCKPFRVQEVAVSCEIYWKSGQSKFLVNECFFKINCCESCSKLEIFYVTEKIHENYLMRSLVFSSFMLFCLKCIKRYSSRERV